MLILSALWEHPSSNTAGVDAVEPVWIGPFLASLARDDLAPATLRGYRYDLRHFLAWHWRAQHRPGVGARKLVGDQAEGYGGQPGAEQSDHLGGEQVALGAGAERGQHGRTLAGSGHAVGQAPVGHPHECVRRGSAPRTAGPRSTTSSPP